MSLTLAATDTITGVAGSATSITYTITGDEIAAGADAFKVLAQGQLPSTVGTLYTVPASTEAIVKTIHLVNMTAGAVTARLNVKGTAAANAILPPISILAGGFAVYADDGWRVYNDQGQLLSVGATGDTGPAGLTWLGAWSDATDYVVDDAVDDAGSSYVCILGHKNYQPPNGTYWEVLAAAGMSSAATPAIVHGTAAAIGAAATAIRSDATIVTFDVTAPTDVAAAAAVGSVALAARRDHAHGGLGLPLALTGATAATRYVGATATGAPASGTFAVGDFVITQDGSVYICTGAGSPGTWAAVTGGGGNVATDAIWDAAGDLAVGSGANTAAKLTAGAEGGVLTIVSSVPAWVTEAPLNSYLRTSGSGRNDEFNAGPGIDGKWTLAGNAVDDVDENNDYAGILALRRNDTGSKISIYYQDVPSAPFTIYAKVRASTYSANYCRGGGIALLPATPTDNSAALYLGFIYNAGLQVQGIKYSNLLTYSALAFGATASCPSGVWVRIDVLAGGTTADLYWSNNGYLWTLGVAAYALGFTVANAGVAFSPEGQALDLLALFESYRVSA